jgi:hypothetical protein
MCDNITQLAAVNNETLNFKATLSPTPLESILVSERLAI